MSNTSRQLLLKTMALARAISPYEFTSKAKRVFSKWARLVFGFNSANEQMDVRYARVRKADGTVVTAAPDAVKETTSSIASDAPVYTDYKEKHVTIPALAAGDTLEYEIVTRTVSPLAPGEFWFDHNFISDAIALDEHLEITVPAGRAIKLASPKFHFEKTDEPGRTVYRWKRVNLKHSADDDKSKEKEQRTSAKTPDVQLTTFASWNDVARLVRETGRGPLAAQPRNSREDARADRRPHIVTRENPGDLRIRLAKYSLRQHLLRPWALSTAFRRRSFFESIWRLQRQAHAARFHARCRWNSV